MSAGHHAHRNDVPAIDDATYARVRNLVDACRRNRDRTIPWLANRSTDGRIVYIDELVPRFLPRTGLDTGETLPYHELGEWDGMNEGLVYDDAHKLRGNPCEKRRVEELGGDWVNYQDEMAEYIRLVDDEAMTSVPADIDRRVFIDDGDRAALEAIINDNKHAMRPVRKFVSGAVVKDAALGERQIRVIASDPTPDRVKDIMVAEGCRLDNYNKNPIVLAGHDPAKPIGTAKVEIRSGRVEALIDFAPAGISHTADECCGLAKAGVLNTVSVGFDPIDAEPIKGGGLRYKQWELMELSLVAVPANPEAIVIARSVERAKSDVEWKVGASRNLPIDEKESDWDADAAKVSIFEQARFDGDSPDTAYARKGFLIYDPRNPMRKDAYRLPFARVEDGRLTAVVGGIRAAASRLADLPSDAADKARAVIEHYEGKMKAGSPNIKQASLKGLYEVAQLAYVLGELGWIQDLARWEAEAEQDGSKLPAMLAQVLSSAAEALVAMTQEETAELLAGRVDPLPADVGYVALAVTPVAKNLRAAFRKAGRVLSRANLDHLSEIHKCLGKMADCYTKAADLHDDVHAVMQEWMGHGTSAGEHAKAMLDSTDDDSDDEATSSPDAADQELAADADARKRMIDVMARVN